MEKRIKTPAERLEYWIAKNYKTKAEFCRAIGINPTSINKYTGSGEKKSVFGNKYQKELRKTGLNYHWYVTGEGEPDISPEEEENTPNGVQEESNVYSATLPDGLFVRFVNVPANAGEGYNFDDEPELLLNIERKYDPKRHIAMKVVGDSMMPELPNMTTVIIDIAREPRTNDIVLALVNGIMYVKRLMFEGDKRILKSDNPNYNSIIINGENNATIKGVVVETFKKYY